MSFGKSGRAGLPGRGRRAYDGCPTGEEGREMEAYRLPQRVEQRLEADARRTGRSFTAVARQAVLEGIQALEDRYRVRSLMRARALPEPEGASSRH